MGARRVAPPLTCRRVPSAVFPPARYPRRRPLPVPVLGVLAPPSPAGGCRLRSSRPQYPRRRPRRRGAGRSGPAARRGSPSDCVPTAAASPRRMGGAPAGRRCQPPAAA
eukprot:8528095-Pyramimonas_sp.AAC.3